MTKDEKYMLESIYHNCQETAQVNLAQDTIDVTLNMAGYDISRMSQFEKAHALMDMAQELKALASVRQCDIDNEDDVREALDMAQNFGRNRLSSRR